jgi:Ca-activated chloride channel family protein
MQCSSGLLFFVIVSGLFAAPGWGRGFPQDGPGDVNLTPRATPYRKSRPPSTLRLDVKMVLVPVSVTDALDRPVNSLSQDRFRVLEDGVAQKITSFSQEDGPISLGLLFDSSGSMRDRLAASIEAMKLLFKTTFAGDEFFLVQFSDQAHLLAEFAPEPQGLFGKLGLVQARGWTALLDAIAMGSHEMRRAKNPRRVLLILSDGNDNNSRFTEAEIRSLVLEGDLRVYGIGLAHRPRLLERLAEETGGNVLIAQNVSELPDVVQRLSREIRSQYVVGYSTSNLRNDGKYRKVKVEVMPPPDAKPLRVSWRHGYYAPEE